jgi:hypothetical protein
MTTMLLHHMLKNTVLKGRFMLFLALLQSIIHSHTVDVTSVTSTSGVRPIHVLLYSNYRKLKQMPSR